LALFSQTFLVTLEIGGKNHTRTVDIYGAHTFISLNAADSFVCNRNVISLQDLLFRHIPGKGRADEAMRRQKVGLTLQGGVEILNLEV
jgi:hypothetical protein